MSEQHSELLSPSGSGLWLLCTAMPGEKKAQALPYTTSLAAERGTLQHHFAEQLDTGKIIPEEFSVHTSKEPTDTTLTIEEWTLVRTSTESMKRLLDSYKSTKFKDYFELAVGFTGWREDCFGTLDRGRLDITNRTLFVLDHKFGRGVVPAQNNSQLRIYALATLDKLREKTPQIETYIDTVVLGISQPRVKFEVDVEIISLEDLKQWDRDVLQPAQRTILDGTGVFNPGGHCKGKYCKVRNTCSALNGASNQAMDDFMDEFHEAPNQPTQQLICALDDDALQDRLDQVPLLEGFISMLKEEVESRIRLGMDLERYKIINGRGKKVWKSEEEEVVKVLKNLKIKAAEMYKKSLLTPKQVKDTFQDKLDKVAFDKLEALIEYQPGSEKLVSAKEKGEPLHFGVSSEEGMDDLLGDILGDVPTEDFSDLFADLW